MSAVTERPIDPAPPRSSNRSRAPNAIAGACTGCLYAATWVVLIGGIVLALTTRFDWSFLRHLVASSSSGGVEATLILTVPRPSRSPCVLAVLGALGRLSTNPVINGAASLYVSVVRGTPLLVQIFVVDLRAGRAGHRPRPFLGGHHLTGRQLRRLHDRDLPRRDPGRAPRPAGGGPGAGHARAAGDAPDRAAAGGPGSSSRPSAMTSSRCSRTRSLVFDRSASRS